MRAMFGTLALLATIAAAPAQVRVFGAAALRAAPAAGGTTLLEVLGGAKIGLNGDLAHVVVLRVTEDGEALALCADVRAMLANGDTSGNVELGDDDVVFVPAGRAVGADAHDAVEAAIDALAATGRDVDRALALCLRALHCGVAAGRAHAIRELCEVEVDVPCLVPTLRKALADAAPMVVREAVTALGVFGPRAAAVADELRSLCEHDDAQIRARARVALGRVSGARR